MINFVENKSISNIIRFEYINKINSLINKLLYSPSEGFLFVKSKQAFLDRENIIQKFDFEADKITQELKISTNSVFIKKSKEKFVDLINSHCVSQLPFWIDEVFDEYVSNLLFELSIDKTKIEEIGLKFVQAIDWYSEIKSLNEEQKSDLTLSFEKKAAEVLNKSDEDYLTSLENVSTNYNAYINLWDLIIENTNDFLKIDFSDFAHLLNNQDIKYFQGVLSRLNTYKKTQILDEIKLINAAIIALKIDDSKQKYDFISDIRNDFICYIEQNKSIKEQDKVDIIKRRMKIFEENKSKKDMYYLNIISV